jgi:hypothetical protein
MKTLEFGGHCRFMMFFIAFYVEAEVVEGSSLRQTVSIVLYTRHRDSWVVEEY